MKSLHIIRSTVGASAIVASALSVAHAQTAPAEAPTQSALPASNIDNTSMAGEIVVTARRREESAQRVPVSLTALGPELLETRSVRSLDDLTTASPGLRFAGEGNANVSSISLRGLSKIAASSTGTPAVVVYFSEVPLPGEGLALPTFDLANVQVLKGPQGTLFGRNTIGGAVLVTPRGPDYDFGGYGRLTYGNLDYKAVEGAVNIPIVDDKVALRVAGQLRRRNGFVTDINSGDKLMNIHQDAYRVSLLLEPVPGLSNTTVYDYFKARDNGTADIIFRTNENIPGLSFIDPFVAEAFAAQRRRGIYVVDSDVQDLFTRIETWGVTNTTSWEISDNVTLKNIFGYRENELETRGNNDGLPANPTGFVFYKTLHSQNNDRQISDELQIQGQAFDNKLDYILGAFYLKFEPDGKRGNMQNQFNSIFATSSYVEIETKAIFAQIGYDLSSLLEGLKLNIGGRYTWTKQEACGTTNYAVTNLDDFNTREQCYANASAGGLGRAILKSKEDRPTWTIGLDYQAADNVFLYAVTRRGFREGGINGPLFNSPAALAFGLNRFQTYDAEIVTDIEIGAKTDWRVGDVRGRLNIAAFRNWYDDAVNYINVTGFVPVDDPSFPDRGSFGFNAADLTISGIEIDGNISPTPGMVFSFSGTYLDQKVKRVTNVDPFPPVSVTLPSPEFSYTIGWDFTPQADVFGGELNFHFDYYWMDDYQVQSGTFPGYDLGNARLDLRNIGGSDISAAFFVRNVFDNEYLASPVIGLPTFPTNIGNPGEPRNYGLELSYKF